MKYKSIVLPEMEQGFLHNTASWRQSNGRLEKWER